jgi:SAM-dependent methyltransferase
MLSRGNLMSQIDRREGRRVFGADPAGYDRARPDYPGRVYDLLRERCGLQPGSATFEIGPGTGVATRHLFQMGAAPLIVIEPDERLAAYLGSESSRLAGGHGFEVKIAAFEDVELPPAAFDLGVAATSFHWLEQGPSLLKVARTLRPGGWWAAWWNVFGDPERTDAFHEATQGILSALGRSPSSGTAGGPSFALDVSARVADLQASGEFDDIAFETIRWTASFDSGGVRSLYATFSEISRLAPESRHRLLDDLVQVAEDQFGGRVEKPMTTPIYTARRRSV